ncbi:ATP-binding cassette domain-containing protein [Tropicimonas sp. TH_r6]|uniref:sugar ABC transporter ATP-binding protein n=1 Tax=Tropicimonas sp. TH_r6 TaxID=3082085 RepID=UPI002955D16B|nr:ATP-binding cassette domain-containing protein [Tropicimonas sp. TH_r6]MDV7143392.1 ATP-binding cassette domain-containing protein [Tropicimonas sp. TH_r6]
MTALLQLEDVDKAFGAVRVLRGVDFTVKAGRVVALAGENGAGKSTLMKIITGIYHRDAGVMRLRGEEVQFTTARQSMDAGIAMIHQELNLLPALSVGENIFLGREPTDRMGRIRWSEIERETRHWLGALQQDIDPWTETGKLSIAQQQMVEIARALSMQAEIIIMDEPTDALTDVETQILFGVVEKLRGEGKGLVFISHRLGEIFRMCDDVAVLRDGNMIHQGPVSEIDEDGLIRHMVGRELSDQYPYIPAEPADIRLKVVALSAPGVRNVSFEARAGEVVGFAGLVGAGRTELGKAIYGANPAQSGTIEIDGQPTRLRSPRDGVAAGIGYVTEDRKLEGLIQAHGLRQNLSLTGLFRFTSPTGHIDKRAERAEATRYINAFSVKTHGIDAVISQLSGGNQQKVSIAKSLVAQPRILILDEPTRGVDVGAKREIYQLINELKAEGLCILLMSSDMPELMGISDRILVMSNGLMTGDFTREEADQEAIMRCTVAGLEEARVG